MFEWTDQMGPAQGDPALEADTRTAIAAAAAFLEALENKDAEALPRFTGGFYAEPANELAVAMAGACMSHVKATDGVARATMQTRAVRLAFIALAAGGGEAGWAAIAAALPSAASSSRVTRL